MLPPKKPLLDPSWLLCHRLSWISKYLTRFHGFLGFHGPNVKGPVQNICHRDAGPKETLTRSQLAAISPIFMISQDLDIFYGCPQFFRVQCQKPCWDFAVEMLQMDFWGFHEISWVSADFKGPRSETLLGPFPRDAAPEENFTQFQPVVFSSILIDSPGFHEISSISTDLRGSKV